MRKNLYIFTISSAVISAMFLLPSCAKLDKVQKEWVDGPEQIYVGRLDSLVLRSGINKVELVGNTDYIRTAKTCVVRYDGKELSYNMSDIIKEDGKAHMAIDHLEPGVYYFDVTTYDEEGNRSVVSEVSGTVYDRHELDMTTPYCIESIAPRSFDGPVDVFWRKMPSVDFFRTYVEMSYTDAEGVERSLTLEPDAAGKFPEKTTVDSWTKGGEIHLQSYVQRKESDLDIFPLLPNGTTFPSDIKQSIPHFENHSTFDLGASEDYHITDAFTIELMARCSEIQPKDGCIISTTGRGDAMLLRTSRTRLEYFILNSLGQWKCIACDGLEPGRWYHMAVTYEANKNYSLYLDGNLVASANDCGNLGPKDSHLIVGVRTDFTNDYMVGDVQHVSVWEDARSAEMIKADMKLGFKGDENGLLGYFPMDIQSGRHILDITGQHTGTYSNVQWKDAD